VYKDHWRTYECLVTPLVWFVYIVLFYNTGLNAIVISSKERSSFRQNTSENICTKMSIRPLCSFLIGLHWSQGKKAFISVTFAGFQFLKQDLGFRGLAEFGAYLLVSTTVSSQNSALGKMSKISIGEAFSIFWSPLQPIGMTTHFYKHSLSLPFIFTF